jgi:hypothetical protein
VYTKSEDDGEYVQQYGGYEVFRLWAWFMLYNSHDLCKFINLKSLMPFEEIEQKSHLLLNLDDDVWNKLFEYEEEVKRELEKIKKYTLKLTRGGG